MVKKQGKSKKTANTKNKTNVAKDERVKLILGLFNLFLTVYLLFGFISYLFTWKMDQSKLDIPPWQLMMDSSINIENWAGKLGGLLAHLFLHNWFGLSSFGFLLITFLLGFRMFGYRVLPLRKTIKYVLITTIWVSITLGFIFHKSDFSPGGAHGYFMSEWLNSAIGKLGTALVLLISLFGVLAFAFDSFTDKALQLFKLKSFFNKLTLRNVRVGKGYEEDDDEEDDIENDDDSEKSKVTSNDYGEDGEDDEKIMKVEKQLDVLSSNQSDGFDNIETIEVKYIDSNISEESKMQTNIVVDDEINEHKLNPTVENPTVLPNKEKGLGFAVEINNNEDIATNIENVPVGDYDPTLDLSNYKMPDINFLVDHDAGNTSVSSDELSANKDRIVETLAHYKIEIVDIKAIVGPTITLYEIVPAPGVRLAKIKNLEDDIALSLAALGIRIIAPIPGKKAVGIEVPNLKPKVVSMRSIIASTKFQETQFELPLALGKTISNETFIIDLAKAPHMLVAGATGQGKSVGLNAILTSLLYKKHPAQLKLVLVDPKKVELTLYQKIEKHYLAMLPDADESIITDTQKVVSTLNSLCFEMDSRYDLLKAAHCRNLKEYNVKFISRKLNPNNGHKFLPYIVVVIDEFADLIMTAGKEVELPIARLAQLARAIGIHLIIATQRPTTNIITGLIKANFPVRLAFRVTSMMDSRTILDSPGANQLIGRGDMLISQGSELVRLQCAFVDTPEIENIVSHIEKQQSYPSAFMLPECSTEESNDSLSIDLSKRDAIFDDAARLVVANQQGSTSLIQRKFSIGYNRAGRVVDQLEAANIVGPFEGSKARQVLVSDEYSLEQLLKQLDNGVI